MPGNDEAGGSVELEWPQPARFDHVVLQEHIELGQRIRAWTVEAEKEGGWAAVGSGKSIGQKYILRCAPVIARRVRVAITKATASPALRRVGVYCSGG
jgi:alpha-L-fucosidase